MLVDFLKKLERKPRCPEVRTTVGYSKELDDYIVGADMCVLSDKECLLESGDTCDTYEKYLREGNCMR